MIRTGLHGHNGPGVVGVSAMAGGAAVLGVPGVDWSQWFDHFWQAKGAPDYATSLLDQVGAQNLVEGNGAVPWNIVTGWGFVAALAQWLDTGLIDANVDQDWSVLVQYDNMIWIGNACLAGVFETVGANQGSILIQTINPNSMSTRNGLRLNRADNAPQLLSGNYGIAGRVPYRDGIVEVVLVPVGVETTTIPIWIGCNNINGGPGQHCTADIIAVGIKKGPALTALQVAAAALAMSLL